MTRNGTTQRFATITTEGALLPADLLQRVAENIESLPGARPEDYHLTPGRKLREAINRSWADLNGAWRTWADLTARTDPTEPLTTQTRERWVLPLLAELGYGRVPKNEPVTLDDRTYNISHMWQAVPIHIVGANTDLDTRTKRTVSNVGGSPHSMLQEFLNCSDTHLWAILTNGRRLRLLRDNTSLTRAAYVEFDLDAMFTDQHFEDFVVLWLTCHQSRIEADPIQTCWLEQWVDDSRRQGVRALERLRGGVEDAIRILGSGFLANPANQHLRTRIKTAELNKDDYYRQLLRLVYRLVFLLVAEDRDLLHPADATSDARQLYAENYSISRIRDLARRRRGTKHHDLWESLKVPFTAFSNDDGLAALGLPGLNGFLWSDTACTDLNNAELNNIVLLAAVRGLSYTNDGQRLRRVDYRNLGAEELGSVYEALLELRPTINTDTTAFNLTSTSGNERKTSGSYYTPTPLITALLDVSLEHLLDEAAAKPDPIEATLALTVCDPACGSGHFLVAAAQRIARRVAQHRTGELEPAPEHTRHAMREVIGRCIYGIDINPMAVELCKVNLWLEAVEPGKPLSFLDHHIVCGNALIGATPALLANDIPTEAFKRIEGDDKDTCAMLGRVATRWAKSGDRKQVAFNLNTVSETLTHLADSYDAIDRLDDDTVSAVREKERLHDTAVNNVDVLHAKLAADTWCAAFFDPKVHGHNEYVTSEAVARVLNDPTSLLSATVERVEHLATTYRFLHPHITFPHIFRTGPSTDTVADQGWSGGFDLVLGNPPWKTLSPDLKEFFGAWRPDIRGMDKEQQAAVVEELTAIPDIKDAWSTYRRDLFAITAFLKDSGRFTLYAKGSLGKGDFNIYRMFVEVALRVARPHGYAAQVVPAGLYGGANASAIRKHLLDNCDWQSIYGFVNTGKAWFPAIHAETTFSTYSARPGATTSELRAAFGLTNTELLNTASHNSIRLTPTQIRKQSPDTYAISDTTDTEDAMFVAGLYARHTAFSTYSAPPFNRHYQAELHMGNDRDLLMDSANPGMPVYEGRMIDRYDHRAKAYHSGRARRARWDEQEFGVPGKRIVPQWRFDPTLMPSKLGDRTNRYRIAFCNVASPGNERSMVAALIPPTTICGDTAPTLVFDAGQEWAYLPWLAVANSFIFDFIARKRLSSPHMTFTVLDALPFPKFALGDEHVEYLAPRALRLTCTGPEMHDYWNAMAHYGWCDESQSDDEPMGSIDLVERATLDAEIDTFVAKVLFGVSRSEFETVLGTFGVLKRREERTLGRFATMDRLLDAFDALEHA